ncbi:MAG: hypothetical protein OXE46_14495 [Chloroflexi bacterium]|nr:hypothetical protein [Chloroflexota bacterium]
MTLIIGVRCGDGIVIGSDSVTTYSSFSGQPTIEQEIDTKVRIINNNALYASAGEVGPSQDILSALESNWTKISRRPKYHTVKKELSDTISGQIKHYARRKEETLVTPGRNNSFVTEVGIACVLAVPIADEHHLFLFDQHGNPEEYRSELPIVTVGSGQVQADPFLAFVKRVAWNDKQPATVKQGIAGVLWTLQYVIARNSALGVGGQPSIGILEKADRNWEISVHKLGSERLSMHIDAITNAEQSLFDHLNEHVTPTTLPPRSTRN